MEKGNGRAKIDLFGCPLRCGYCTHNDSEWEEKDMMEVLEFLADPDVGDIYVGGAEPLLQRREIKEFMDRLSRMKDKRIVLKTSGYYPEELKETLGKVDLYVVEMKCPLDDIGCNAELTGLSREKAGRYVENLVRTLDLLKGRQVRIWIRVIPGFVTPENIDGVGESIQGRATEAVLLQFLSDPGNERPFRGIDVPGPDESDMVKMGRRLINYVPKVIIRGEGFANEFEAS
ncbi:MAG: radical SAM protein [Thermoplasmatota archaeon]